MSEFMDATVARININVSERVIPDEAAAINGTMTAIQEALPPIIAAINEAARRISAIRDAYALDDPKICGAVSYILDERGPLGLGSDAFGDLPYELAEGLEQAILHRILLPNT